MKKIILTIFNFLYRIKNQFTKKENKTFLNFCDQCQSPFLQVSKTQRFCCQKCRYRFHYLKYKSLKK